MIGFLVEPKSLMSPVAMSRINTPLDTPGPGANYVALGLDAPTFMLRNNGESTGLFPIFVRNFDWLWDRSTIV